MAPPSGLKNYLDFVLGQNEQARFEEVAPKEWGRGEQFPGSGELAHKKRAKFFTFFLKNGTKKARREGNKGGLMELLPAHWLSGERVFVFGPSGVSFFPFEQLFLPSSELQTGAILRPAWWQEKSLPLVSKLSSTASCKLPRNQQFAEVAARPFWPAN